MGKKKDQKLKTTATIAATNIVAAGATLAAINGSQHAPVLADPTIQATLAGGVLAVGSAVGWVISKIFGKKKK